MDVDADKDDAEGKWECLCALDVGMGDDDDDARFPLFIRCSCKSSLFTGCIVSMCSLSAWVDGGFFRILYYEHQNIFVNKHFNNLFDGREKFVRLQFFFFSDFVFALTVLTFQFLMLNLIFV